MIEVHQGVSMALVDKDDFGLRSRHHQMLIDKAQVEALQSERQRSQAVF